MKKLLLFSILSVYTLIEVVQAQPELFSRVLLGSNHEDVQIYDMIPTHLDSYILVGENWSQSGAMVGVIDNECNVLWSSTIKKANSDSHYIGINKIIPTFDSCFLITGETFSDEYSTILPVFIKMDVNGDTVWAKRVVYAHSFSPVDTYQTSDTGFIVVGYSSFSDTPNRKLMVSKLNALCNPEWTKIMQLGDYSSSGVSVKQTSSGNFLLMGNYSDNSNYDSSGAFMIKLDSSGELMNFGGKYKNTNGATYAADFQTSANQNYLCINTNNKVSFLITDTLGTPIKVSTYSNIAAGNMYGIAPNLHAVDDGFAITFSELFWGTFIKFNDLGEYQFAKYLNLLSADMCLTSNNEFLVYGNGPIWGVKGQEDYSKVNIGLIQMDEMGNGIDCVNSHTLYAISDTINHELVSSPIVTLSSGVAYPLPLIIAPTNMETREGCIDFVGNIDEAREPIIQVFPNPCQDQLTFSLLNGSTGSLVINNSMGQEILRRFITEKETEIGLTACPDGVYLYRFIDENKRMSSGKLILKR